MMKNSIQTRLILGQIVVQMLVVSVVSVLIYQFVAERFREQFDYSLEQIADSATKLIELELEGGQLVMEIEDDYKPNINLDTTYQQIWSSDAQVRYHSPNVVQADWKFPELAFGGKCFGDVVLPDGRQARYCMLPFQPYVDDGAVVEMDDWLVMSVRESSPITEPLAKIRKGCFIFAAAATLLSVIVNFWMIRRGLRPLKQISGEVESLDLDQLDHRISEKGMPVELRGVTEKLNEMLARVEEYIGREKRFTRNVAHELRTPLAEMKMISEVGASWKPEFLPEDDPRVYFQDYKQVGDRMQVLLETLLAVVNKREDALVMERAQIPLAPLVHKVVSLVKSSDRVVDFEGEDTVVDSNLALLEGVLVNLIGNAYAHSTGGIRVTWSEEKLCVSNQAGNLEQQDLAHLTEAFWQKDAARTSRDNFGLGLHLSQAYCDLMGASLEFSLTDDGEFVACVSFGR